MLYRNGVPVQVRPGVQDNPPNYYRVKNGVRKIGAVKRRAAPASNKRTGPIPGNKTLFKMDNVRFKKYYQSNEHFRIDNPNPDWAKKRGFQWDRGDCSIRALANAISCEWVAAFDFLNRYARRDFNVCNDFGGFRKWVVEGGAKWTPCKAEKGKSRMTVKEFAETHPSGRYVVQVASHFTACVDGVILDVWNCGEKCVVGYYDMATFKLN